jgi:hypothetical protein
MCSRIITNWYVKVVKTQLYEFFVIKVGIPKTFTGTTLMA